MAAVLGRLEVGTLTMATLSVQNQMKSELGVDPRLTYVNELLHFVEERCPDELMPSLIESVLASLARVSPVSGIEALLNEIMAEHRVAFELIDGEMIEFESKEAAPGGGCSHLTSIVRADRMGEC